MIISGASKIYCVTTLLHTTVTRFTGSDKRSSASLLPAALAARISPKRIPMVSADKRLIKTESWGIPCSVSVTVVVTDWDARINPTKRRRNAISAPEAAYLPFLRFLREPQNIRQLFLTRIKKSLMICQLHKHFFERLFASDFVGCSAGDELAVLDNGNLITDFLRDFKYMR